LQYYLTKVNFYYFIYKHVAPTALNGFVLLFIYKRVAPMALNGFVLLFIYKRVASTALNNVNEFAKSLSTTVNLIIIIAP